MRDVLHDGGDIDDGIVAFQHAELEVVEIEDFHLALPRLAIPGVVPSWRCNRAARAVRRRARQSLYRFSARSEPGCLTGGRGRLTCAARITMHHPGEDPPCRSPMFAAF